MLKKKVHFSTITERGKRIASLLFIPREKRKKEGTSLGGGKGREVS